MIVKTGSANERQALRHTTWLITLQIVILYVQSKIKRFQILDPVQVLACTVNLITAVINSVP